LGTVPYEKKAVPIFQTHMKILMVSSEVLPFSKTGGLADVAGILPLVLKEKIDCDVRVISPFYRMMEKGAFDIKRLRKIEKVTGFAAEDSFELLESEYDGVPFYFIGKDEYFDREYIYGTARGGYADNAQRFSFFSRAVLASLAALEFYPDIIHINDWQTALIPLYKNICLQKGHPLQKSKILFAIHNLGYQGNFAKDAVSNISLPEEALAPLLHHGKISFIKSGILYSDAISTVSKKYAEEILTPEFGCGLDDLLRKRKEDLYGILNGVDYSNWDPKTDKLIPINYDIDTLQNKRRCKIELLKRMKINLSPDVPLFGSVGRLAEQKGVDIIIGSIEEIVESGAGFVLLGAGEERYENMLKDIAGENKGKIGISVAFDNKLAHMIEAGCDMFVMPSRYEPCGLNQMYSLRYGTVPVVRATGGLDDTIIDYSENPAKGNGFKFEKAKRENFLDAVNRAIKVFRNKKELLKLQKRGMESDFSWRNSVKEYINLYRKMIEGGKS
jgi:starch synthase